MHRRSTTRRIVRSLAAASLLLLLSAAPPVAARYPQLAGIEIWNEPNMTWAWAPSPDPARYTQLLRLAYDAVKAVNPSMPVIGGSLAANLSPAATSASTPIRPFLQSMYDNGARGHLDGISI